MAKTINMAYHTQINNRILPYVTCGATAVTETLDYLNQKYGSNFVSDDDEFMQVLNSEPIRKLAKDMIIKGLLDPAALNTRADNAKTDVDESQFTHLNNYSDALCLCANYITNNMFKYQVKYLTIEEIKAEIDKDLPIVMSALFTSAGHFVVIKGYTDNNEFVVDDPYGYYYDGYKTSLGKGKSVLYKCDDVYKLTAHRKGKAMRTITITPAFEG